MKEGPGGPQQGAEIVLGVGTVGVGSWPSVPTPGLLPELAPRTYPAGLRAVTPAFLQVAPRVSSGARRAGQRLGSPGAHTKEGDCLPAARGRATP